MKKKKKIPDDELDRELVLSHKQMECNDRIHDRTTKIKVGKKVLTISGRYDEASISFEKRNHASEEHLEITTRRIERVYHTCNLGHKHESDKKIHEFNWFEIPWSNIESLIEWLRLGTWTEVQRKEPKHKDLLRQAHEMLGKLREENVYLKPAVDKLRNNIAAHISLKGYREVE